MALTEDPTPGAPPVLAHSRITETPSPSKWLYVVHGIFGAGRNWASVARRVVRTRPDWGALLIDLREHGGSQDFPGPHTLEAAADDLAALAAATGIQPSAILGHSFGGKVSMMYARRHAKAATSKLEQVWIIDSTPAAGTPGGSAHAMLDIVKALPSEFASRDDAIAALQASGVQTDTASWMATNLAESGGVYRWRFRLASLTELLDDFFHHDLWDVVETPPAGVEIHLVKATESSLLSGTSQDRAQAAADNVHTFLHEVEGGHWLNADNPDALVELLTTNLPE
ncbi:MAG: alpha/beta hydrolase [Longimicrobiales bacterium]